MNTPLLICLLLCWAAVAATGTEPTALRAWHAKTGQQVEAKALQVTAGKVQLERADGGKLQIDLDKLTAADQAALREHFGLDAAPAAGGAPGSVPEGVPEGVPADDLPYPLGTTTEAISCGDEFHYFLYLPKSLRKGAKHPVIFVMSPGGGSAADSDRYRPGAERNRWIIAVSQESQNGSEVYQRAVDSMIRHVTSTLPINPKRMYASGYSGGSRVAFSTAQTHKDLAGVIACAAGGNLGSAKQVVYGLSGTNCFNRTEMACFFRSYKSKDCVLRYFPGAHDWADEVLCDDAITHLNGVFLTENRTTYPDECAFYVQQVMALIGESSTAAPLRAYMWSSFLTKHSVKDPKLAAIHATLGQSEVNKLYVKGLADIQQFAEKAFAELPGSRNGSDPKASAACKKEAKKYAGTPWEDILNRLAGDA